MKIIVSYGLECGQVVKTPEVDYPMHTDDIDSNQLGCAQYDSMIGFNRPGNRLFCQLHDEMHRIKRISIYAVDFDEGLLS